MLAGKSGMREFRRDNRDWCVFFKPFERAEWEGRTTGSVGWSVGVVYPEEDIFGIHNVLVNLVVIIAILGMMLFYVLCRWILRRQLKPVKQLAKAAHQIAEGNYNEMLPYSDRQDEIGLLQNRFEKMQHSLQKQANELEEEAVQSRQYGEMTRAAYDKITESDKLRMMFLHYMTSEMFGTDESIDNSVTALCNTIHKPSEKDVALQVNNIQRKTQSIVELLNHIAHFSDTNKGKEAAHA